MAAFQELTSQQQNFLCDCKGFKQAVAQARENLNCERQPDGKIFWISGNIQPCPLPGCDVGVTVEEREGVPGERINVYCVEDAGCKIELDSP